MSPVSHDTRRLLIPSSPAIARQVIPVEWLIIERSFWRFAVLPNDITQGAVSFRSIRSVGRFRKSESLPFRRADADDEDSITILSQPEGLCIKNRPADSVSCGTKAGQLVQEEVAVLREPHAVDVFNDERKRAQFPQHTIILLIQKVDPILVVSTPRLAVPRTRIATDKDIS